VERLAEMTFSFSATIGCVTRGAIEVEDGFVSTGDGTTNGVLECGGASETGTKGRGSGNRGITTLGIAVPVPPPPGRSEVCTCCTKNRASSAVAFAVFPPKLTVKLIDKSSRTGFWLLESNGCRYDAMASP
jgi:hypothetical protein